jgi:alpha-glucosidase
MPWHRAAPHGGFTTGTPWLPVPDEHVARAVDMQDAVPGSLLNAWRRFLHWRKSHEALRTGALRIVPTSAPFVAFERFNEKQKIVVILNFSAQTATLSLQDIGEIQPLDVLDRDSSPKGGSLTLSGWGVFLGALPVAEAPAESDIHADEKTRNNFSIKRA